LEPERTAIFVTPVLSKELMCNIAISVRIYEAKLPSGRHLIFSKSGEDVRVRQISGNASRFSDYLLRHWNSLKNVSCPIVLEWLVSTKPKDDVRFGMCLIDMK